MITYLLSSKDWLALFSCTVLTFLLEVETFCKLLTNYFTGIMYCYIIFVSHDFPFQRLGFFAKSRSENCCCLLTDDCWHFLKLLKHKTQHLIFGTSQPSDREICYSFPFPVRLRFNKNEIKEILAGNFGGKFSRKLLISRFGRNVIQNVSVTVFFNSTF